MYLPVCYGEDSAENPTPSALNIKSPARYNSDRENSDHLIELLDLSDWNHTNKPIRKIEGEWLFYWKHFISAEEFSKIDSGELVGPIVPIRVPIPKDWGDIAMPKTHQPGADSYNTISASGWATYRRKILLPATMNSIAFRSSGFITAYKIWVNGELILSHGVLTTQENNDEMAIGSLTGFLNKIPENRMLDVVVHVSSFNHPQGGAWRPIDIGDINSMITSNTKNVMVDSFVVSTLLIMAFYHFGLYAMRRKYLPPLLFCLFCFAIGARTLFVGAGSLATLIFGEIDGDLAKRIEYGGFYIVVPLVYYFLYLLFPKDLPKLWAKIINVIFGTLFTLVLFFPITIYAMPLIIAQVATILTLIVGTIGLILAAYRKRVSAYIVILGSVSLFFASLNDILLARSITMIDAHIVHIGFFIMVFCQAIALARLFTQAFVQVEVSEKAILNLNDDLKQHNEHLDQLVEEKTRDIRSILDAIQQGILAIETDTGVVGPEHSEYLTELVGTSDITGRKFYELLFQNAEFTEDQKGQMMSVISASIGMDEFNFNCNSHLLPREMIINLKGTECIYELDWNPVISNDNVVKILLVVRDVTELRVLQDSAKEQREEIEIIQEIINIPIEQFDSVINACARHIEVSSEAINNKNDFDIESYELLYRNMHTMKGLARSYNMKSLAEASYQAEAYYKECKKFTRWDKSKMMDKLDNIQRELRRYQLVNDTKLGRSSNNGDDFIADRAIVENHIQLLSNSDFSTLPPKQQVRMNTIKNLFNRLIHHPLEQVLYEPLNTVPEMARLWHKAEPEIIFEDPGYSIHNDVHELLNNVFAHLIRHSLSYGLETAEERIGKGKPEKGKLTFSFKQEEELVIRYWDDGAGLDLNQIYQIALKRSLISENEAISRKFAANLIFKGDFFTGEEIAGQSERGVGLDTVRNFLEDKLCSIEAEVKEPSSRELKIVPVVFAIRLAKNSWSII